MKNLNQYIKEKLIINKDYSDAGLSPKSFDELRKIIKDRYNKLLYFDTGLLYPVCFPEVKSTA